jgi:dTDP-4-dehydrorhamnose reductase
MKILVLGHKGMLGSDLVSRLSPDHEVAGKDIDDFDLTSLADCRDVIAETGPDCVINAAAYTDVDGCETNREACFSVNAEGVRNIATACGDAVTIVHFSTDYVFDGTKREPYVEDDLTHPINAYGQSKLQGEQYLKELTDRFVLVRTAWLYGRNGRNFVKTILEKAGTTGRLQVVHDQVGSPTYTRDLAGAVKILVEGGHCGVFHLTNRGRCSWYEFTLKILEYADLCHVEVKPIASDRLTRKALRPAYSVMSGRKFASLTGKTTRFWQVALRDFIGENKAWLTAGIPGGSVKEE